MATGKHSLDSNIPSEIKKRKVKPVAEGSGEDILLQEVKYLIRGHAIEDEERHYSHTGISNAASLPFSRFDEIEVTVEALSSTGDGLALVANNKHIVVVPFTAPGDKVTARIHHISSSYSLADLVKVVKPSAYRDDTLVTCQYFGKCSGCQFQMIKYEDQLEFKRTIILKAYQRYFGSETSTIPQIEPTHPSPLQYGYRTKITPHFDIPRSRSKESEGQAPTEIGFVEKGRRRILDIEECPIATPALNVGLAEQRKIAKQKLYKRGATILLREALEDKSDHTKTDEIHKRYVTDPKGIVTESVNGYKFEFPAGSFFQNNNSILPDFTEYAHQQISDAFRDLGLSQAPKFLVDTYCGSGLFSVTCSKGVESVVGVEISPESSKYATANAKTNNIANAHFVTGTADKIFEVVTTPPDNTAVIIDPPRKGCDENFLEQLLRFNPRVVVYVSCNVHTQARDIAVLLNEMGGGYRVTAIKGFDLFPQTYHVESIATLVRYQEVAH